MPKLLQINCCNNVLSTGKIVAAIGDLARIQGFDSYIAYSRGFKESGNISIRIGSLFDTYAHFVEQRLFDNTGFGFASYFATKKLVKLIKKIDPDIIHLHILVGYYLNFRVLFDFLSKQNVPIVWTIHSCWEFTGHCTHFDYIRCDKWKTQCHHCPLMHEYPQSWLLDNSVRNYQRKRKFFTSPPRLNLVAVSHWLDNTLSMSFFKEKPRRVIYNGVDTDTFHFSPSMTLRIRYGLIDKFVAIGVASSWTKKKGIEDYYELSSIIPDDMVIVMIGLDKRQMKQLPEKIIGVPRTTDLRELVEWYSEASVVLNLSYEESFGLTTVEGFACGTPSIVYNKTASPELVSSDTGYIVDAGDIKTVLRRMKEIKDKGKAFYSDACRKRAVEKFDKNKNFQQYIDLYNELLCEK